MSELRNIQVSPVTFRPETVLRASPIGECAAMLIAVHAMFGSAAWISQAPMSGAGLIVPLLACWIIPRSVGVCSGRWFTPLITLSGVLALWWSERSMPTGAPAWLVQGPFGPVAFAVLLSAMLVVDTCDIPWKRGMSLKQVAAALLSGLSRVPAKWWGWGLVGVFAVYMILIPGLEALLEQFREPQTTARVLEDMTFSESVRLRTTEAFTAVLFFVFGATVGSFLNVVVYRTPRGDSLIWRRSACPKCGSRIAGRDNVPVLGWIWLQGKCRSCQLPISVRYPLVEASVGGLFLIFYFVELLSGGKNLPVRIPNHFTGVVWIIFYTKWDLIGLYLFHSLLMVSLLAWSLIRFDGQRVRWRSLGTTFTLAIVLLLIWPHLMLVSWNAAPVSTGRSSVGDALLSAGIGGIAGAVLGAILQWLTLRGGSRLRRSIWEREFAAGLTLVGVMLGWQAVFSVTVLTLLIYTAWEWLGRGRSSRYFLTASLFNAVMLQMLTWRLQESHLSAWWPVTDASIQVVVVWSAAAITLMVLARTMRRDSQTHDKHDPSTLAEITSADAPIRKKEHAQHNEKTSRDAAFRIPGRGQDDAPESCPAKSRRSPCRGDRERHE